MQWLSVADFFNMGGYAFYVWGSFGITVAVAVFEVWQVRSERHHLLKNLVNPIDLPFDSPLNSTL